VTPPITPLVAVDQAAGHQPATSTLALGERLEAVVDVVLVDIDHFGIGAELILPPAQALAEIGIAQVDRSQILGEQFTDLRALRRRCAEFTGELGIALDLAAEGSRECSRLERAGNRFESGEPDLTLPATAGEFANISHRRCLA